jgi:outer membrane beta-barrel protein
VNLGVGYRLIAKDWLALHVGVRDHIFESDLLGTEETYHNLEFSGAFSLFF